MSTTEKTSFKDLINGEKPVLVDFFADWCGPCKMLAPELQKLKSSMGGALQIVKIDVDKNPAAAQAYQVRGVPTMILFRKGEILWQQSGVMRASQLENVIRQNAGL